MNFTADWFSNNIPNFEKCMAAVSEKWNFLEIGSYEGMSACWLLANGLEEGGYLTCIDPFFNNMRPVFESNTREAIRGNQVVSTMQMTSYQGLAQLIGMKQTYDFIYIDGNHTAYDTLSDACMSWGLLKQGGVMLFDDYEWNKYPEPQLNPKIGIDSFLNSFDGYELIIDNYQLAVRKL
jgi:predicted O-methyltransferase YrrM